MVTDHLLITRSGDQVKSSGKRYRGLKKQDKPGVQGLHKRDREYGLYCEDNGLV